MLEITRFILVIGLVMLLLPTLLLFSQIILSLFPARKFNFPANPHLKIAILVPAHNEEIGIEKTIKSLTSQLKANDRLLIVADNCSDNTSQISKNLGAEVIERKSELQRGKGYALDYGLTHLKASPPDIVIIIDADCIAEDASLQSLALYCNHAQRPIQSLYLMRSPNKIGLKGKFAEFAWLVKNYARPLGFSNANLPCQLMGTGMAFPWSLLIQMNLASGHIVEDMKLGIDLAKVGKSPQFLPQALVTSSFPSNVEGTQSQSTRWEHGHLGMIIKEGPVMLAKALYKCDIKLFALVADMCIPPLALLVLMVGIFSLGSIGFWIVAADNVPAILAVICMGFIFASIVLAWVKFGQHTLSLIDLIYAPIYILAKLPIYVKFLIKRQAEWVRSKRDS